MSARLDVRQRTSDKLHLPLVTSTSYATNKTVQEAPRLRSTNCTKRTDCTCSVAHERQAAARAPGWTSASCTSDRLHLPLVTGTAYATTKTVQETPCSVAARAPGFTSASSGFTSASCTKKKDRERRERQERAGVREAP